MRIDACAFSSRRGRTLCPSCRSAGPGAPAGSPPPSRDASLSPWDIRTSQAAGFYVPRPVDRAPLGDAPMEGGTPRPRTGT